MPDLSNRIRRPEPTARIRRPKPTASNDAIDLRSLARLGAEARLVQIQAESKAILAEFPELRRTAPTASGPRGSEIGNGRVTASGPGRGSEIGNGRARRRPMSAAERKAVSLRMKKYWAGRRKAKATA
jgi:hypothetical protein